MFNSQTLCNRMRERKAESDVDRSLRFFASISRIRRFADGGTTLNRADSEVSYCVATQSYCFPRPFLVGDRPRRYSVSGQNRLFKLFQE